MNIIGIGIETEIVTDIPVIPDCSFTVTETAGLLSLVVLILTMEMAINHVVFWIVIVSVTVTITVTTFV